MNLKLTGFRVVLGGPSDPGGFVHNFNFEKIRLMRKKSLLRLKNDRIFYISPSLKTFLKLHWGYVLEAQILSMCPMALLFCSMDSLDIVLHSKNLFGE